jgi:hypothetical protein
MSKVSVTDIKSFMTEAMARSTTNRSGTHRTFLVQDKNTFIEMCKNCLATTVHIAKVLSSLSIHDTEAKWVGRINTWSCYHRDGRLEVEKAVAVQRPKQVDGAVVTGSRLKAVVREYLDYGITDEEVLRIVGAECLQHGKSKVIKEMKDYMNARGLTLDDLK